MRLEPEEKKSEVKKRRKDALDEVIGICEGPEDLAEKHDSYAY